MEGILLEKLSFLGVIEVNQGISSLRVGSALTNSEKLLVVGKDKGRELRGTVAQDCLLTCFYAFKYHFVVKSVGHPAVRLMPHYVVVDTSETIEPINDVGSHYALRSNLVLLFVQEQLWLEFDFKSTVAASKMIVSETFFPPDALIMHSKLLLSSEVIVCRHCLIHLWNGLESWYNESAIF